MVFIFIFQHELAWVSKAHLVIERHEEKGLGSKEKNLVVGNVK
jgi:hypothetical protein